MEASLKATTLIGLHFFPFLSPRLIQVNLNLNLSNFELEDSKPTLVKVNGKGRSITGERKEKDGEWISPMISGPTLVKVNGKGRSIKQERKENGGEWISLMHKGMGEYIGNPVRRYRWMKASKWDSVKLDKTAGHYMICDTHGNGMKWNDVEDGMIIKIRAKLPHWERYEYLESDSPGDIWLDERKVHKRSQNWEVHFDETDSTVAFESLRWSGFYLGADDDDDGWLELKSKRKIKWIASAHVPDDNNSEN